MNEFIQNMNSFIATGEGLPGNSFLIKQLSDLIKASDKQFWIVLRTERPDIFENLYFLERPQLLSLIEDLEEYRILPSYKKIDLLGVQTKNGKIISIKK